MSAFALRPAVFLDRDGVININRPDSVGRWEDFVFIDGALDALARLAVWPGEIVVVTNQAMIGRGLAQEDVIKDIHRRMRAAVAEAGGRLDAVYYCPHRPEDNCDCRKPRPGMLLRAARERAIDLSGSYFVGDAITDVQAAVAAGVRPILVATGRGVEHREEALADASLRAVLLAEDLGEAVAMMLEAGVHRRNS